MASKEEEFKTRFVELLTDLHAQGRNDRQAMWLVGSVATNMLDQAEIDKWGDFKRALSQISFDQLLATLQAQGNEIANQGKEKLVYAIQALAVSLVARTQTAPEVVAGDPLLDQLIDAAVKGYRQTQSQPAPSKPS